MNRFRRSAYKSIVAIASVAMIVATSLSLVTHSAGAAAPPTLTLNVLLIGNGTADPTTVAWQSALSSEGVSFTNATASGTYGSETVALPALTTGSVGDFNAVVIAGSPFEFAAGQLTALDAYESTNQVRQLDGYSYPSPTLGQTAATSGALDGTTGALTAAGLAGLPNLKGPVPFSTGTYGTSATFTAGSAFTPWIENSAGQSLGGVFQHPSGDPQAGVSELSLNFNYNSSSTDWLLLAPGLINWVTKDTHLGLYRNYFGQDIDDIFINDNEWSSQYQCTPAATDPSDYTCPTGVANNAADSPPDVQMSAADVAYVAAWEAQTGIKLNLAFNAVGACTADTAADETSANCTGSVVDPSGTYTDPGQAVEADFPNDQGFVKALLADKADFNWITHTWSHEYLGCNVWQPQAVSTTVPSTTGGSLAGSATPGTTYTYEVTAATAYGESEPSTPQIATLTSTSTGSVTLTWPDATNGTSTDGTVNGPTLAAEEANHTGGTGFWGYNVYRELPSSSTFGLIGQVPEAGTQATYSFTDTGTTTPGAAPSSSTPSTTNPDGGPTATNPGIDCAPGAASWDQATSTSPDSSIDQEIGLDQAFASANALPNYTPAAVVTGEHSGIENPNMPGALAGDGVTTFATDASRQPTPYTLTSGTSVANSAPRYPSNIYYNASTWTDELNEYNTLYVAPGTSIGDATYPTETGHCAQSSATTCLTTPATETSLLASESSIMLSHVLANNPIVGYAHQTDLIGGTNPANGYTILSLIDSMLAQYNAWTTTPLEQMTDVTEAQVLAEQAAWAKSQSAVTATETNGVVTINNTSGAAVSVPVTTAAGTTDGTAAFGESYGGTLSDWSTIAGGGSLTLTEHVAPTIISANAASSIVGAPFTTTIYTDGYTAPVLTESGAIPAGLTFVDNGNGTATISGTSTTGSGGSYPITVTATNPTGTTTQTFTLTNSEAPSITSAAATSFYLGAPSATYTVTTTGFPAATITESGTLPAGLSFAAGTTAGTATISGVTTAAVGPYPVTISATNSSGSTATLNLVITVAASGPPIFTSTATPDFNVNQAGSFAVTTTAAPDATLTETGLLPAGLSFAAGTTPGTALISGTPTVAGTTSVTVTATNSVGSATQTLKIVVASGPTFTSANSATFVAGAQGSFAITTGGVPAPSIGWIGTLPSGITLTDNGDGTATLAGTPAAGLAGTSTPITLSASNAAGNGTQDFTISIVAAPPAPITAPPAPTTAANSANSSTLAGGDRLAATPDGKGYWLVGTDGGVFSYGDAQFYGSTGNIHLNKPIMGIASTRDGKGYWMVAVDGGIFNYGDAGFFGSGGNLGRTAVGLIAEPSGPGYSLIDTDGSRTDYGW